MLNRESPHVAFKVRFACTGGTGGESSYTYWDGPWATKTWKVAPPIALCIASISPPPEVAITTMDADKNGVRFSANIVSKTACKDIAPTITPYLDGTALPPIILVNAIAPLATYSLNHAIQKTLIEGIHELKVCANTLIEGESCDTKPFTVTPPEGCTYNNPACGSDSDCVENKCILKQGCQYNNPACSAGKLCQNNTCISMPTLDEILKNGGKINIIDYTGANTDIQSFITKLKESLQAKYPTIPVNYLTINQAIPCEPLPYFNATLFLLALLHQCHDAVCGTGTVHPELGPATLSVTTNPWAQRKICNTGKRQQHIP